MIDPRIGEQLELFPETKPPEQKRKTKKTLSFLSEKDMEMIWELADVVEQIQIGAQEYKGEDLEEEKFEMLHHLRIEFGIPEWISRELVMPFYNVPNADSEYLLEHLLESLNPRLYQKYLLEKEEQFKKLLKGDALVCQQDLYRLIYSMRWHPNQRRSLRKRSKKALSTVAQSAESR